MASQGGNVGSGAVITIGGVSATTDGSGIYSMSVVAAANDAVTITQAGYVNYTGNVIITNGSNTGVNFTMTAIPGNITGTINVSDITVTLTANNGINNYTTTSSSGTYTITSLPPGSYNVTATATGYQNYTSGQSRSTSTRTRPRTS